MLRQAFPRVPICGYWEHRFARLRHQMDAGRLPVLEVDALVRDLLDEPAFTDGIELEVRYGTWGGLGTGIAQLGQYTDRDVDHVVADAEAMVTDQAR